MKLYHQIGWGMMSLSKELQERFGPTNVILSPRDLTQRQLIKLRNETHVLRGCTYIDPQFYLPRSDHNRLISHPYWPQDYKTDVFLKHGKIKMIRRLAEYNNEIGTDKFIIPGERAIQVNDLWINSQNEFMEISKSIVTQPLIMTICLSSDAVKSTDQIHLVMELAEKWHPDGFYLVLEHPSNRYIINDPIWLVNSVDLAAGLSLLELEVIVGYSNQQQLLMAGAGVTGIASGNYRNVRMFPIEKFKTVEEDDVNQRTTWYYCPQSLSEFKLQFIETAIGRFGLNPESLKPDFYSPYLGTLFEAPRPTLSGWKESYSFKHFLYSLSYQCINISKNSYEATINEIKQMINRAEETLNYFNDHGLRSGGGDRNFHDGFEATRTALDALDKIYGPRLRRKWVVS